MFDKVREVLRKVGGRQEICVYCRRPITPQQPRILATRGPAHMGCVRYSM